MINFIFIRNLPKALRHWPILVLYAFGSLLIDSTAVADEMRFAGLLVVSRNITQPQTGSSTIPSDADSLGCASSSLDDGDESVRLPPLPDEASISRYRAELKTQGWLGIEPSLSSLDRAALEESLQPLQGNAIDQALLDKLHALVLTAVNEEGSLLADIFIPPQRSDDGYVVVVIAPARVGKLITTGQEYFDGGRLACEMRSQPGERVDLLTLNEDLQWLNRTPWRYSNVSYAPGARVGETDITLTTQDRLPFRIYLSGDNAGTRSTGMGRFTAGFSYGNPFGLFDHRLDYSYTRSDIDNAFNSHAVSYSLPVLGHSTLSFNASRTDIDVDLEDGAFHSDGSNTLAAVSINRVLPNFWHMPNLLHEGTLGLEYKRIGNTLLFGNEQVNQATPEILQFFADYSVGLSDNWGKTNFYSHWVFSPGFGFGGNNDNEFEKSRPGTDNQYWYFKQIIDRTVLLPSDWSLRGTFTAQLTDEPLLYSERLGLTGVRAVRGYYEDSFFADRGFFLNFEITAPTIDVPIADQNGQLQFFAFRDWGVGFNKTDEVVPDLNYEGGREHSVGSLGIGTRFSYAPYVQFNASLAWADDGLEERSDSFLGNVSMVIGF